MKKLMLALTISALALAPILPARAEPPATSDFSLEVRQPSPQQASMAIQNLPHHISDDGLVVVSIVKNAKGDFLHVRFDATGHRGTEHYVIKLQKYSP